MRKKKLKSKLSKKYVTDGELLKDVRDQLIVELPKLTRRRAMATVTFYTFTLGFVALFFVDCSKTRTEADLVAPLDAEVAIVKLPEPDWQYYGLSPGRTIGDSEPFRPVLLCLRYCTDRPDAYLSEDICGRWHEDLAGEASDLMECR